MLTSNKLLTTTNKVINTQFSDVRHEPDYNLSGVTQQTFLLLIDRHKQEVFGENVNMAGPSLHPLVPHVTIPATTQKQAGRRAQSDLMRYRRERSRNTEKTKTFILITMVTSLICP